MFPHLHDGLRNSSEQREVPPDVRLNVMGRDLGAEEKTHWVTGDLEPDQPKFTHRIDDDDLAATAS